MASIQGCQIKHMSEQVLEYLLNTLKSNVDNMTKMAVMSILLDCFKTADEDYQIRILCLKNDLVEALQMVLDIGLHNRTPIDTGDITYINIALALLWQLLLLPTSQIQAVLTEAVIRRLLGYLDIHGSFYIYSEDFEDWLQSQCGSKVLISVVDSVPMSAEVVDCCRRHGGNSLNDLKKLPDKVYQCALFQTDGEGYADIGEHLKVNGLSWTHYEEDYHKRLEDSTETFVIHVLKGGLFWAHIGETAMETVSSIQGILNSTEHKLLNSNASVGDYVAVSALISDVRCIVRCQVLEWTMGMAKVFAVDYGFCLNVRSDNIFKLPPDVTVTEFPTQASLCYIAGLRPPPIACDVVQSATVILCRLCKHSFAAGVLISSMGGLDILKQILQLCPEKCITLQLIKLLNNLACDYKLGEVLASSKFMKPLIAICRENLYADNPHNKEPEKILLATMSCICNLMYKNDEIRKEFYQSQGLDVVLRVIMLKKKFSASRKLALKLLRIFVGDIVPERTLSLGNSYTNDVGKEKEKSRKSLSPITREALRNTVHKDDHTTSTQKMNNFEETKSEGYGGSTCTESQATDFLWSNVSLNPETVSDSDADVVDTAALYKKTVKGEVFVLDSQVDFDDGVIREFRPNLDVDDISSSVLVQYICGMMNTGKGGVIYFGIDRESQTVRGMYLDRNERDEFRLGVDRMMCGKITPSLLHSQFHVAYVPVVKPDSSAHPVTDRFVVEIIVKATKGILYTVRDNGACYYRLQAENLQISTQELREIVILDEETKYISEIQLLNDKYLSLLAENTVDNK